MLVLILDNSFCINIDRIRLKIKSPSLIGIVEKNISPKNLPYQQNIQIRWYSGYFDRMLNNIDQQESNYLQKLLLSENSILLLHK